MLAGCGALPEAADPVDDPVLEQFWVAFLRGDDDAMAGAASQLVSPEASQRAAWDRVASQSGRAVALWQALAAESWWSSRYRAGASAAVADLSGAPESAAGGLPWLEAARRAGSETRRRSLAQRASQLGLGRSEAWAVQAESLLLDRRWVELDALLQARTPLTPRLAWVQRRRDASLGATHAAVAGLLEDVQRQRAVPEGLQLLQRLVVTLPDRDAEQRLAALLDGDGGEGVRWQRARLELQSVLAERAGDLERAASLAQQLALPDAADLRRARRLNARLQPGASGAVRGAGERVDLDAARLDSRALVVLRTTAEWDLAARASYGRQHDEGFLDLEPFLALLDEATLPLGSAPRLASLPRRSFGVFGEMLDTTPLDEQLPGLFVLAGKGLGQPAELTAYDLQARTEVADERAADGRYSECLVTQLRVPGQAAAAGGRFTGAGLVHTVFLDQDEVESAAVWLQLQAPSATAWALPAAGASERRALDEPLDTARRIQSAVGNSGGAPAAELMRSALGTHEAQHIADAGRFLASGFLGRVSDLISAGVLPSSVRAELERRAQLAALRNALDPRVPLAQLVAEMPVEGTRRQSEHARGYEQLLSQFVTALDREEWPGSRPLSELGIDRGRVLLQQLHLLDAATVSAIARSLPLD